MMATKQSTSISTHSDQGQDPAAELSRNLTQLRGLAKIAAKHGFKLGSHGHYSVKARDCITEIRSNFLLLRAEYPSDAFPLVSEQLDLLVEQMTKLEQGMNLSARDLLKIVEQVEFKVSSDLRVAIRANHNGRPTGAPFITPDILLAGVYRKVLEEANRCYPNCPNACAAMLRRLIESLIIEAFEAHGVAANIKDASGEYLELKALIGKAIAEPKLNLTRNTRNALPNLKFLGDLSVHARRNLVRSGDLKKIENDARAAIEELASHLPKI
jgi:hypothetical protein